MAKKTLTQATYGVENVQGLADQVKNQASVVKQTFDKTGLDAKTYTNNTLISELQSETNNDSGAHAIGLGLTDFTANNMADGLQEVKDALDGVVLGQIPDGSLTRVKLDTSLQATTGIQEGIVLASDVTLTLGTLEYGQTFEFYVKSDVASATINTIACKDIEGNSIDLETNTVYVGWLVDDTVDFFVLAPRGSGGDKAFTQQYDLTNAVLKDSKGKDITVKTGDYIESEFYEVFINDGGAGQIIPALTQVTLVSGSDGNNKALIDGTLEMYNPVEGYVYNGHVSKVNRWLPSMEGGNPFEPPNYSANFELVSPLTGQTMELRETYSGSGIVQFIGGGQRPFAFEIDGVRYPSSVATEAYQNINRGWLPVNIKFNSEFKLYQTTGNTQDQIFAVVAYDDGTYFINGNQSASTLTLRHDVSGKGIFRGVYNGYFHVEIDGNPFVSPNSSTRLAELDSVPCEIPFETGFKVYSNSDTTTISYGLE